MLLCCAVCCAGPRGRRGDQVGGYTLMHREDLRRVAPLWLQYTEAVRFDPDVSPDVGVKVCVCGRVHKCVWKEGRVPAGCLLRCAACAGWR